MGLSPFAIVVLEREELQWAGLPGMLKTYAQDAGGFAFVGLLIYIVVGISRRAPGAGAKGGWPGLLKIALLCGCLAAGCYAVARTFDVIEWANDPAKNDRPEYTRTDKVPQAERPQTPLAQWSDIL